ncbi:hypothetical protein TNCV_940151 [Trichonephila clavipes]|nr:hypothetical protein TNCV_940151 [Trichonephila clavipes]
MLLNSDAIEDPLTTRGLLATELVILNHGQVTRTTPELAHPSPNFNTIPMGVPLPPYGGASAVQGSNSLHASHESITLTTKVPWSPRIMAGCALISKG